MKISEDIYFLYGIFGCNVGIIKSNEEVALVDTGFTEESVDLVIFCLKMIAGLGNIKYVFVTHADRDHIGGLHRFQKKYGAKLVIHKAEASRIEKPKEPIAPSIADITFEKDRSFEVGNIKLRLITTPGHTIGSTCIYDERDAILFSGDTLVQDFYHPYIGGTGRFIHLPIIRSKIEDYLESLARLVDLDLRWILPGHGRPVRNGKEKIIESIAMIKNLKNEAYGMLVEDLCPSELAEKLHTYPEVGTKLIDDLEHEGKVKPVGTKVLQREHTYRQK